MKYAIQVGDVFLRHIDNKNIQAPRLTGRNAEALQFDTFEEATAALYRAGTNNPGPIIEHITIVKLVPVTTITVEAVA